MCNRNSPMSVASCLSCHRSMEIYGTRFRDRRGRIVHLPQHYHQYIPRDNEYERLPDGFQEISTLPCKQTSKHSCLLGTTRVVLTRFFVTKNSITRKCRNTSRSMLLSSICVRTSVSTKKFSALPRCRVINGGSRPPQAMAQSARKCSMPCSFVLATTHYQMFQSGRVSRRSRIMAGNCYIVTTIEIRCDLSGRRSQLLALETQVCQLMSFFLFFFSTS